MQETLRIVDVPQQVGTDVTIAGRVASRRDMGKIVFLDVRDRYGLLQVVLTPDVPVEDRHAPHPSVPGTPVTQKDVREGSYVRITGRVKQRGEKYVNPNIATGTVEMEAGQITIIATSQPFPFDPQDDLHIDTYLDHLPFTLRTDRGRAIFRVQAAIVEGFRSALTKRGFTEFHAPSIVGGSTEGGANVFTIDYFGKPAFLAQSPQFYKQIMVGIFERAFTVATAFRAELHATSRHLNEYCSLDFEFGPITDHRDVMRMQNDMLIDLVAHVRAVCADEIAVLGATLPEVPPTIPSLKLREAQEVLKREFGMDCVGEPDLEPEHERKLCEWSAREHSSDFLYVTHYPTAKRPLYTMPDPEDPEFTLSFDLLFRGVEITTGGQRIHDYEMLKGNIVKWGLDPAKFTYYLEAFQYGMPPEGGLAIGLERLTQKLLGLDNVKLATLFPRDIGRIDDRLSAG
ncbi:MAG: aspartate--tRNA(Asn) ligase [bacterium]|nr:aspartate--tRNA(Asn) ligase [bacterium]